MEKSSLYKYFEWRIGKKLERSELYTYIHLVEGLPIVDIANCEGVTAREVIALIKSYTDKHPAAFQINRQEELLELGKHWRNNYTPEIKEYMKKCYHATDDDVKTAKKLFEQFIKFCYVEGVRP